MTRHRHHIFPWDLRNIWGRYPYSTQAPSPPIDRFFGQKCTQKDTFFFINVKIYSLPSNPFKHRLTFLAHPSQCMYTRITTSSGGGGGASAFSSVAPPSPSFFSVSPPPSSFFFSSGGFSSLHFVFSSLFFSSWGEIRRRFVKKSYIEIHNRQGSWLRQCGFPFMKHLPPPFLLLLSSSVVVSLSLLSLCISLPQGECEWCERRDTGRLACYVALCNVCRAIRKCAKAWFILIYVV